MSSTYAPVPTENTTRNSNFYPTGYGSGEEQRARSDTLASTYPGYYGLWPVYFMAACGCDTLAYSAGGCSAGECWQALPD